MMDIGHTPLPLSRVNRRRALRIVAGAAGMACLPWSTISAAAARPMPSHRWEGTALGAEGSITLYHTDARQAQTLLGRCADEIERLESLFSLYRPNSALCRLNRTGKLAAPPEDFLRLLITTKEWHRQTGGAFDVSVQPLWELYVRHFATPAADPGGPAVEDILRMRALVDARQIAIFPNHVRLEKTGMALTFNGIAQGYITDRIAAFLKAEGMDRVLVELGEFRALGTHPDSRPWRIGIADPKRPWRPLRMVELHDRAMATSGGYGMPFDASGHHHHLFDPSSGRSASYHRSVTVIAPDATTADALSTALTIVPRDRATEILAGLIDVAAIFVDDHSVEYVGPNRLRNSEKG